MRIAFIFLAVAMLFCCPQPSLGQIVGVDLDSTGANWIIRESVCAFETEHVHLYHSDYESAGYCNNYYWSAGQDIGAFGICKKAAYRADNSILWEGTVDCRGDFCLVEGSMRCKNPVTKNTRTHNYRMTCNADPTGQVQAYASFDFNIAGCESWDRSQTATCQCAGDSMNCQYCNNGYCRAWTN